MRDMVYSAQDMEGTDRLGAALARHLPPGSVVALVGTLGAGKTQLVRAVAAAVGVDPRDVVSPTFVLVQDYVADRSICHLDVYRIKDEEEFAQLGPEEFFQTDGLVFIEWADRVDRPGRPRRAGLRRVVGARRDPARARSSSRAALPPRRGPAR